MLALRVYTSRLLGGEPRLVLHGGGNTSVKTDVDDLLGEAVEVLCVKGCGWDMATIEPPGLPAVRLAPLRKLRERDALSDEDMVRVAARQPDRSRRAQPVGRDAAARLPAAQIHRPHPLDGGAEPRRPAATAERCADLYGERMGFVPYIMPGFRLAKNAAEVFEADPAVEGLVLLKHGIFTFGDTAREAYERMIAAVSLAEERLARGRKTVFAGAHAPAAAAGRRRPRWRRSCAAPAPSPTAAGRAPSSASSSTSARARRSSTTSTAPSLRRYGQPGSRRPTTRSAPRIIR